MASQYPSTFIQQYSTKIAFLIDCAGGLDGFSLSSRFMDNFPPNSDIFLFYPSSEPGMNRRLERIESSSHGVFFFPTSDYGIECSISFLLGQIHDKYDAFTLVTSYHPAFGDICHQLIANRSQLKNHIQVRSFEHINQFEQFLKELVRLQNDTETSKTSKKTVVNYSKKHLFHSCPFESKEDSTILYRFGDFLHHLDTEHPNVHYDYCAECEQLASDPHGLEEHIQEKHWKTSGFHINLRSS